MKKYAVMLPIGYRGGTLRAAKNIAKSLVVAAGNENHEVEVVFSYPEEGKYNLQTDFADLLEFQISLRPTTWKTVPATTLTNAVKLFNHSSYKLLEREYCVPTDGANDFNDCDLWIVISDRLPAPILPLKNYVIFIYDYIQRYVPEIWDGLRNWETQEDTLFTVVRKAQQVFVTTPSTRLDAIAYAGVSANKVKVVEMDFQPIEPPLNQPVYPIEGITPADKGYILWSTNSSAHKNQLTALEALEKYYLNGGGLDVVVTGYGSNLIDPSHNNDADSVLIRIPNIQECRERIQSSSVLKEHIHFMGEVPDPVYALILTHARFVWNPTIYDNGTYNVIEAAYLGIPSVSARYPAMEFLNQKFNLNITFSDPWNVTQIATTLNWMEKSAHEIVLPEKADLLKHSWEVNSTALYHQIAQWGNHDEE